MPAIDATGLHMLEDFLHQCKNESTALVLSGVHKQPLDAMRKSGLLEEIGKENLKNNIDDALKRAREILS